MFPPTVYKRDNPPWHHPLGITDRLTSIAHRPLRQSSGKEGTQLGQISKDTTERRPQETRRDIPWCVSSLAPSLPPHLICGSCSPEAPPGWRPRSSLGTGNCAVVQPQAPKAKPGPLQAGLGSPHSQRQASRAAGCPAPARRREGSPDPTLQRKT